MKAIFLFFVFLVTYSSNFAQSKTTKGYPIKAYLGQKNIESISISPNGNYLVVVTMQNNFDSNTIAYTMWRFTLDQNGLPTSTIKLMDANYYMDNLKWDKESKFLYFVSRNENGKNIFKMNMEGGERQPIIKEQTLASKLVNYKFFSDKEILFYTGACVKKYDQDPLYADVIYKTKENSCSSQFYKVHLEDQSVDSLFLINNRISHFDLSPNKKKLVFMTNENRNYLTYDKKDRFHAYLFDVNEKKIERQLTNDGGYEIPMWWDDRNIVFRSNGDPKEKSYNYRQGALYGFDLDNSSYEPLCDDFSGAVANMLKVDGKLVFTATVSTRLNLYETSKGKVKQLSDFEGKITGVTYSNTKKLYAFAAVTKNSFPEVYVAKKSKTLLSPIKISRFNEALNRYPKPKIETIQWKNAANEIVEGVLISPPNASKNEKLPLVVDIHGGPWSARYEALSLDGLQYYYYGSLLASKGFLVLQPNYSGSIGRGNTFVTGILESPIKKPANDIIKGVEYLIKQGKVDKENMVVMGASYGGVLTNSILAQTDMFAVALPSCGNWNEILDYGISDGDILQGCLFKGKKIWDAWSYYWEESPVSGARNIKTPTLITHGENDVRVPTAHAKAMYYALEDLGVEVELVIFPKEGHLYQQPKNKLHKVLIEMNWINSHIKSRK